MTDRVGLLSESWEARARDWINWVRAPDQPDSYWRFHREKFLALVPDPGELTVDIGCGEGRVGRDLLEAGHKVFGIDRSFTMINALADHDTPVPAVVADAVQLPLADASADCAIAFMSLQDIDDMRTAVKEAARVLKDGRHLVLAIVHPVYSGGEFSDADANADPCFVLSQPYFKFERRTRNEARGDMTMVFDRQHRPLQEYAEALTKAGFIIEQLHEVTEPDETALRNRVPMFLDILAKRLPRESSTSNERMNGGRRFGALKPSRRGYGNRSVEKERRSRYPSPTRRQASQPVVPAKVDGNLVGSWSVHYLVRAVQVIVIQAKAMLGYWRPH